MAALELESVVGEASSKGRAGERVYDVRRVAVLGAGTMGARIAAHIANAGLPVLLLDIVPANGRAEQHCGGGAGGAEEGEAGGVCGCVVCRATYGLGTSKMTWRS